MSAATLGVLAAVGVRTGLVLLFVIAGIRLFGKRHVGELNVQDVLMVLMMANAVQNAMTTGNGSLSVAFVSSGVLILIGKLISSLVVRSPNFERRLTGSPVVIVHGGEMIRLNMRREKITEDEVRAAIRKQGIADVDDVKLAVLEMDGSISVVSKENAGRGG